MDAWMQAMRKGDFAAAWAISDRIRRERTESAAENFARPRHLQQLWDGRPLDGRRVLVHCYHGLGDTIQFVRLLPRLRRRASEVVLWAQPALLGLLRGIAGADRLEPLHDGAPDAARDVDIELMELPHALRLSLGSIPARVPYLHVRPLGEKPLRRLKQVGLVWRAGDWDATRSIPARLLGLLRNLHGVQWISLQFAARGCPLPSRDRACADLYLQAQRMLDLDLIISVDTFAAHLAGALGLPVWLLLPEPCDWRWMTEREDSPWYPTMRLFRQRTTGDWNGLIRELGAALDSWLCMETEKNHAQHYDAQLATG